MYAFSHADRLLRIGLESTGYMFSPVPDRDRSALASAASPLGSGIVFELDGGNPQSRQACSRTDAKPLEGRCGNHNPDREIQKAKSRGVQEDKA